MKKKFIPNAVLPKGAVFLKAEKRKISGWVDHLVYDAKIVRHGLTWYRVRGGFGADYRTGVSHHPSESWVLDLPRVAISVSDEDWVPGRAHFKDHVYSSMEKAMLAELRDGLDSVQSRIAEDMKALEERKRASELIDMALAEHTK